MHIIWRELFTPDDNKLYSTFKPMFSKRLSADMMILNKDENFIKNGIWENLWKQNEQITYIYTNIRSLNTWMIMSPRDRVASALRVSVV